MWPSRLPNMSPAPTPSLPPIGRFYQYPVSTDRTRPPLRMRVSAFDANYPTPEQCRQIMAIDGNFTGLNKTLKKGKVRISFNGKGVLNPMTNWPRTVGNLNVKPHTAEVQQWNEVYAPRLLENMPSTRLDSRALLSRLAELVPNFEGVEQEVVAKISKIAESHLRELLLQLSEIAAHRLEPLKMSPMYRQINDPRKQLKFMDELDKQAAAQQEMVEKEVPIKGLKNKIKETSQKAREIKNINQEEKLNREANEAAIAALGGMRGMNNWNRYDSMRTPRGQSINAQSLRPRTRHINIRDFQCAISCKSTLASAFIKTRLAYKPFDLNERHGD